MWRPKRINDMSQLLKCKPNVAEEIALKFPDGINVSGDYGNQVLYTLSDNRKLYLPPFVAEKIRELNVVPEERFSLCKRIEPGNKVQWEVKRVDPPASGPELVAPANSQTTTVSPLQSTQSNGTRQEKLTQLGNVLVNGIPAPPKKNGTGAVPPEACLMTGQSKFCLQQLIAAIETVNAAEKYAEAMGRPVQFTSEDIRAIGISCFIQQHRGTY
jgi:hypothetical protein